MLSFASPQPQKHVLDSNMEERKLSPLVDNTFNPGKCIVTDLPKRIKESWIKKRNPIALVIDNVLSPEECNRWIEESELIGYEEALVNIGGGKEKKMLDIRNSSRCIIDDELRAAEIWNRIKQFIPDNYVFPKDGGMIPLEVNERLRFLRYDPGEYFKPHCDGSYDRSRGSTKFGDVSFLTLQIYLNEGFEGGATRFFTNYDENDFYDVVPKTGSVLIFEHGMYHSGEILKKGRKYAIRSDIMFTKPAEEIFGEN